MVRERYSVMLNGYLVIGVGLSRVQALSAALGVVNIEQPSELRQVDIIEQETREKCARWLWSSTGWSVASVPEWLS